jgi:uronate dehydrogenase
MKSTILITGAAGRIGRTLTEALDGEYLLRLYDKDPPAHRPHAVSIQGDLRNRKALLGAMQGADAVIHLAGIPEERPLEELIEANMLGTYSVFEAARLAHVPRVIFASSIQAVGFHRMETGVSQASRIRPSGYYGVTKAFGEGSSHFPCNDIR